MVEHDVSDSASVQEQAGLDLIQLGTGFKRWVTRRSERLEMVDFAVARRTVRVDVNLAAVRDSRPDVDGMLALPIAMLDKDTYSTIEAIDESGQTLARLNKDEERALLVAGLRRAIRQRVPEQAESLSRQMEQVVNASAGEYRSRRGRDAVKRDLTGVEQIDAAVELFGERFLLVVLVPGERTADSRRVFTYSFVERIGDESQAPVDLVVTGRPVRRPVQRALAHIGWIWTGIGTRPLRFSAPGAGDCVSFHFEAVAPYDTVFDNAELALNPRGQVPVVTPDTSGMPTHAHCYCRSPSESLEWAFFQTDLRLRSSGLVRAAAYSAGLIAGSVLVGLLVAIVRDENFRLATLTGSGIAASTAASLLVLVPGVLGSALAAPGGHDFTITLLYPTRFVLTVASLSSYAAAIVVAFDLHGHPALLAWVAVVLLALVPASILYRQFKRVRTADAQDRR